MDISFEADKIVGMFFLSCAVAIGLTGALYNWTVKKLSKQQEIIAEQQRQIDDMKRELEEMKKQSEPQSEDCAKTAPKGQDT